jgi:hypothetical protein
LALASGELGTLLADLGVEAVGQRVDPIPELCGPGRLGDLG